MRGRLLGFVLCLTAVLPSHASITGTLMNVDGKPVAGGTVSLHSLETAEARRNRLTSDSPVRTALATAESDAKGKFVFESPKDPVVMVLITANGYAPEALRVERDEDAGAIALSSAETGRGRITANGKPVTGARVIWSGGAETLAITDSEGRYSVPDPEKWANRVTVIHPDFAVLDEVIRRDSKRTDPDRTLQTGVSISGRVVGEDGKTSAANVSLMINGWPAGTSKEDGTFTIEHAPSKWQWLNARTGSLVGARARGGDPAIVVRLARTATVAGSVRDAKTQSAVAGAEVLLRRGRFETPLAFAITDTKGNFTITGLDAGTHEIVAMHPGYSSTSLSVSVQTGERVARTLLATQLARVSGAVINEDKQPIAGARITYDVMSRDGTFFQTTMSIPRPAPRMSAPDGTFVIRVGPEADLQIEAQKKGFPSSRSATLRLAPGERKTAVMLTIPSGVEVVGRVKDRDDRPLAGVSVVATPAQGRDAGMVRRMVFFGARQRGEDDFITTGADGTFTMRLREGTYDISVKREGFAATTVRGFQVDKAPAPIDVTLQPGAEVSGRVVRHGVGIEGVMIFAMSPSDSVTGETGADGSFRLSDLTPGRLQLNFNKADEFIQQTRTVPVPSSDVVIEIPAGGRIAGRVVDKANGQPITNFEAGVSPSRGGGMIMMVTPPQTRPFTSESGTFVLDNVPPGQTTVAVRAPGYTLARVPNVTVEEGKLTEEVQVALERGVRVKGRVTGPDGGPVSGAAVRADMMAGGRMPRGGFNDEMAITDGSGEFVLENMEPGERAFTFSKSGLAGTQKTVNLTGTEVRVDAQLSAGMRVTGTVLSEEGSPVADANVNASSAAAGEIAARSARTDANGSFQMEGVAPGRYNFMAYKTGLASGQLRDFDVASGPVRIVMKTGGVVSGRVIGLTADELPNANVQAQSSTGFASGPVDASGNYRIEGAPTGTVRLMARTTGGMGASKTSPQVSVQIEPGASVQQDLEFRTGTVVRGRVTRDGRPVADAFIMFGPRNAEAQTSARTATDHDGYYEVSGLDDATYTVSVNDIRRTPFSTTYQVRGSGTFNIDITTSALRGRVVDASTGNAIADATVQIRRMEGGAVVPFTLSMVQTDPAGSFTVEALPPGSYHVTAEKDDYGSKTTDVTIGNSPSDLEIKLSPTAGVTLRVVDARDGRPLRAFARVVDAQDRIVYESVRSFFGGGSPEPLKLTLEPGTYRATISANAYATQTITIASPSTQTLGMSPGGTIAVRSKGSSMRRARLIGSDGRPYSRGLGPSNAFFNVDPNPGTTILENVAPGRYTLQILGAEDAVDASTQVIVVEGQTIVAEI